MALGFRRPIRQRGPAPTGSGLPLAVDTAESANPDKVGAGQPVFPPAATHPPGYQRAPINNPLTWLVNALGIRGQTVPRSLNVRDVLPVVDASGFAGWGMATFTTYTYTWTPGGADYTASLALIDPVNTQVLTALFIVGNQTAAQPAALGIANAQQLPSLAARTDPTNGNSLGGFSLNVTWVVTFMIPAFISNLASSICLTNILGPGRYMVAPPGFGMVLCFNQETVQCNSQIATIPGSFGAGR